jgi:chromosome segregation ATPase
MDQLKCQEEGCSELAAFTYVWPWGEQGACCAGHQFLVNQRATNLGRENPQYTAVAAGQAPVHLERDERVNFRAQILTLEDEVKEQRTYAGELYTANAGLNAEVQRLTQRNVHLEATVKALSEERDFAAKERDEANQVANDLSRELAQVKLLVPPPPPDA